MVEGAPPVPMVVRSLIIPVNGVPENKAPLHVGTYPLSGSSQVYQDAVVKVFFSRPTRGLDARSFVFMDSKGAQVPAWVDQIGDGTWGLFPNQVTLKAGETYTARLKAGTCDLTGNCTTQDTVWKFAVSQQNDQGRGDTTIPMGFNIPVQNQEAAPRASSAVSRRNSRGPGRGNELSQQR